MSTSDTVLVLLEGGVSQGMLSADGEWVDLGVVEDSMVYRSDGIALLGTVKGSTVATPFTGPPPGVTRSRTSPYEVIGDPGLPSTVDVDLSGRWFARRAPNGDLIIPANSTASLTAGVYGDITVHSTGAGGVFYRDTGAGKTVSRATSSGDVPRAFTADLGVDNVIADVSPDTLGNFLLSRIDLTTGSSTKTEVRNQFLTYHSLSTIDYHYVFGCGIEVYDGQLLMPVVFSLEGEGSWADGWPPNQVYSGVFVVDPDDYSVEDFHQFAGYAEVIGLCRSDAGSWWAVAWHVAEDEYRALRFDPSDFSVIETYDLPILGDSPPTEYQLASPRGETVRRFFSIAPGGLMNSSTYPGMTVIL